MALTFVVFDWRSYGDDENIFPKEYSDRINVEVPPLDGRL